jgi:acetyl/propionyl-CoA carboxylase alpha subunit/acetyl-CoA carboxylase carboxyltransferase component
MRSKESWNGVFEYIRSLNPNISERRKDAQVATSSRSNRLQKVVIANRGEIAKRFFFALHEEGIPSVAIVTDPDIGQSWYDFADEVVHIGDSMNYTNIDIVIGAALMTNANAIYPGYGFLSEKAEFVRAIDEASETFGREIIFMGPKAEVMDRVGDKVKARLMAKANAVSVLDGDDNIKSIDQACESAKRITYPVMVKLSAGGGGRGIVPCFNEEELRAAVVDCQRLGKSLYNDDTYFIEKFVQKPVHMEVQVFNGHAIGIRKCAVQRRNQKIIEESGHTLVDDSTALSMLAQAQTIAKISGYGEGCGAGTVEYLFDAVTGQFGFLEMNTRLQVEYAVTEQSLGIDIVKWQIMQFDGRGDDIPFDEALSRRLRTRSHAIECRVYAEEPAADYRPAPGLITEVVLPTFNGVRCDFGFAAQDRVASMYDAMIGKIVAYGSNREECLIRLERALQEIYIRGLHTNVKQLLAIVRHPEFKGGKYTNKLLDEFPELHVRPEKGTTEHKQERRGRHAIALGTLSEYIRLVRETSDNFVREKEFNISLEKREEIAVPYVFNVVHNQVKYKVEIYQVSPTKYYIMVDGEYNGKVYCASSNINKGDYIFRYGSRSFRIRVDKRTKHLSVRIKDGSNKVNYFRLEVSAEGSGASKDPAGMVRSPFQCTFVSLAKEPGTDRYYSVGSQVKKGDTILIISSMKMETKITANVDGKIEYLLEDGEISRLILGNTSDGRVLGKSIQEGDVLLVVKSAKSEESAAGSEEESKTFTKNYPTSWFINERDIEKFVVKDPKRFMPLTLELFQAGISGFINRDNFLRDLTDILGKADEKIWKEVLSAKVEEKLCRTVDFYYNILRLFSPVVRGGFSSFQELNYYVKNLDNFEYKPGFTFKNLILSIFENYGLKELKPSFEGETNLNASLFTSIQRSFYVCYENRDVIRKLVQVISLSENKLPATAATLTSIINHEQSEPDDSLAVYAQKVLLKLFPEMSENFSADAKAIKAQSAAEFIAAEISGTEKVSAFESSLEIGEKNLVPSNFEKAYAGDLSVKIAEFGKKGSVKRLYSPYSDVAVYSLRSNEGSASYAVFASVSEVAEKNSPLIDYPLIKHHLIEDGLVRAYKVLTAYNLISPCANNRVEVLAFETAFERDQVSNGIGVVNFLGLKGVVLSSRRYMTAAGSDSVLFHFDVLCGNKSPERKVYEIVRKGNSFSLDLLAERDIRNPYTATADPKEVNIFKLGKWPVDVWARETYDNGLYEELLVDTIDMNVPGETENPKVAAKIYKGKVCGITACFYMKDSRINGGATGDLEGLKYLAAVYISYLKGWPLYVWNDGAGANILQGMVSLNRGAEGFMLNTMSGRMNREEFMKYARGCADRRVTDLFASIDNQFFKDEYEREFSYHFITAIGVGSSAGLDVYGSSQAPVQVILDHEQSYRVLTGSNVIRSVMGEEITNYEIGGARVMSRWAGIVDVVAGDKFNLISQIRRIQSVFATETSAGKIVRTSASLVDARSDSQFSENMIISNVDNGEFVPFKQDYYGGGSVVAGFAKLGGRRVAIIGPRSADGLRSYAAIVRAREVLNTSSRMNIDPILVLGKKWHQAAEMYDGAGVRARMDFVNTLKEHNGLRSCIITDIEGFQNLEIIANCDVIVYAKKGALSAVEKEFVERNAAFVVQSVDEASKTVLSVIDLVHPLSKRAGQPAGTPNVPDDSASPYDMIESVIRPVSDGGEFVEFFAEMNSVKTRSNFITGLCRINGETVGVLADQPLIMGGGADAPCTEKFRVFVQFINRFGIRLLMLSNSSGFIPGTKQERIRIQAIGGEALDNNVLGKVPVVSVVLNQNYGGRQIQAFNKFLRPGIHAIARENATLAVLGHTVAFDLFKAKKYRDLIASGKNGEAEAMKKEFIDGYLDKARAKNDAFATGAVDELITDMSLLRDMIISGFVKAEDVCRKVF